VAVVGGGPAGLMAAEVLASAGAAVTVLERMRSVGRKLVLAGRSGLNLTHAEPLDDLLARYGAARASLEPAIRAFDADAVRAWCADLGQATFVGSSRRVFPAGFRATALLRAWTARLRALGVDVRPGHEWRGWSDDGSLAVTGPGGGVVAVEAEASVLALGGASWPRTGSDGSWVGPVGRLGVRVVPLRPANCGLAVDWSGPFRDRFEGQPLKDVRLRCGAASARGDAVVTRAGLEGGAVYAIAAAVRDALASGRPGTVLVDLRPGLAAGAIEARLERGRAGDSTANALRRAGFAPVAAGLLREAAPGGRLPRSPAGLAALAKEVPVAVRATQPLARAISTAGGVALDEVDDRFMLRRRPGTFVAGEMLDWEAPTGGYLLQGALSTGAAAARGALGWLDGARLRP
jgi:uncharacterized flavoprotein (TIGR03862 family)